MGYGDSLIAAAMAEEAYRAAPELGPVAICDIEGKPRWRLEWDGNPMICPPNDPNVEKAPRITLGGGALPYHPWTRDTTFRVRDHRGSIYLTDAEKKQGRRVREKYGAFVLIDPPAMDRPNSNRIWPFWAKCAKRLRTALDLPVLQLHHRAARPMPGIPGIYHGSFREACAILQQAEMAVITEGGICIAAATVGTPAVVLWGGCVSVETFGYPEHLNIVDDDPQTPCGAIEPCEHCNAAWDRLRPDYVAGVAADHLRTVREKKRVA